MASSRLLFVWICSVFLLKSLPMSDLPMLPDNPILVVRVFFDPNDIVRRRPTCKVNLRYKFQVGHQSHNDNVEFVFMKQSLQTWSTKFGSSEISSTKSRPAASILQIDEDRDLSFGVRTNIFRSKYWSRLRTPSAPKISKYRIVLRDCVQIYAYHCVSK